MKKLVFLFLMSVFAVMSAQAQLFPRDTVHDGFQYIGTHLSSELLVKDLSQQKQDLWEHLQELELRPTGMPDDFRSFWKFQIDGDEYYVFSYDIRTDETTFEREWDDPEEEFLYSLSPEFYSIGSQEDEWLENVIPRLLVDRTFFQKGKGDYWVLLAKERQNPDSTFLEHLKNSQWGEVEPQVMKSPVYETPNSAWQSCLLERIKDEYGLPATTTTDSLLVWGLILEEGVYSFVFNVSTKETVFEKIHENEELSLADPFNKQDGGQQGELISKILGVSKEGFSQQENGMYMVHLKN